MRLNKESKTVLISLSCGILIIISLLTNFAMIARGQTTQEVNFTQTFQFIEYADESKNQTNINSTISLNMPGIGWNVTEIELNFTDIKLGRQLVEVETNPDDSKLLDKSPNGYAVQINLTEPTTIFAVEIFAELSVASPENLFIQIHARGA